MVKVMLCREMLKYKREFYKLQKAVFARAIHAYARTLPKYPEFELNRPESYQAYEIKQTFMEFMTNKARIELYGDAWDIFINTIDHDPEKCDTFLFILEEFVERVMDGRMPPRQVGHPGTIFWKEPKPYGGYHRRKFAKFIQKGEI